MKPMRILLVDDHTLFRRALASLLVSRPGMEIVGEAEDGLEAVAKARQTSPDVILMDIGLPLCSGLEATRRIKAEMPCTKIIMLTVSSGNRDLFAAFQGGADGYLLKNLEPYQLFDMLDGLRRGEAPLSGTLAATILQQFAKPPGAPRPSDADGPLTPREIEVLEHLVKGATNLEIAQALCVTKHTVKLHMRNILDKLRARNRVQAAVCAVSQGLVHIDQERQPPLG
jgi:two-component system nitrate/nitrite response regulator NarL